MVDFRCTIVAQTMDNVGDSISWEQIKGEWAH